MNVTLLKSLVALVPACLLLAGAIVQFRRARSVGATLQLLGAACLIVVVSVHIAESLPLLPEMGWGQEHSIGHYIDLSSAALGFTLFPIGYLLDALIKR